MPFQSKFTNEELITFLTTDEEVVTSDNVKDAAEHFGVKVQSVTKRINKLPQFQKVTRGKWNLTVAEKLEKTFKNKLARPRMGEVVKLKKELGISASEANFRLRYGVKPSQFEINFAQQNQGRFVFHWASHPELWELK